MSLLVLSHPWEVQELEDGILVKITHHDLNVQAVAVLANELLELVRESGQARLYLDFGPVHVVASIVAGKLLALDRELREIGGRLILRNLDPVVRQLFEAENWPGGSLPE
jgi:anti-anti-sigma regulatory factor